MLRVCSGFPLAGRLSVLSLDYPSPVHNQANLWYSVFPQSPDFHRAQYDVQRRIRNAFTLTNRAVKWPSPDLNRHMYALRLFCLLNYQAVEAPLMPTGLLSCPPVIGCPAGAGGRPPPGFQKERREGKMEEAVDRTYILPLSPHYFKCFSPQLLKNILGLFLPAFQTPPCDIFLPGGCMQPSRKSHASPLGVLSGLPCRTSQGFAPLSVLFSFLPLPFICDFLHFRVSLVIRDDFSALADFR